MNMTRAGWATIDITPELGVPLGGRGPQFKGIEEILDPLVAQALVLEDSAGAQMMIISVDLVGIGTAFTYELRQNLAALTGIPYESIIINFSHTHSGPMTIMDKYPVIADTPANLAAYEANLAKRIIQVSVDACANLRAAEVSRFDGTTNIGMNRRRKSESGEIEMQPNPQGFVVRELWGLDIRQTADPARRCILFSAACHAVTVYSWKWAACSADYPGAARRSLEDAYGGELHAQFLQGFGGNVRPARLADPDTGKFRNSVENDHIEIGRELANDIQSAISGSSSPIVPRLSAAASRFRALRDLEAIAPVEHWRRMSSSDSELERNFGRYWLELIEEGRPFAKCVPWEIGVLRISDDLEAVWIAGEVCGEWLPLIRSWTGNDRIRGIGYAQDLPGYLPTAKLIPEGGYEVIRSNSYRKTGPGPFMREIEDEAKIVLQGLMKLID